MYLIVTILAMTKGHIKNTLGIVCRGDKEELCVCIWHPKESREEYEKHFCTNSWT